MFTPPGQDPTTVRTILIVLVLAIFASLCSQQMAHGGEVFLAEVRGPAVLALRPDATITGDDIRLRQIARWADADQGTFDPIGDLVVARFGPAKGFRVLALDELKTLLTDAGVNLATIHFNGPTACRVERSDASFAPGAALDQLTAATNPAAPTASVAATPDGSGRTLRLALTEDLAHRLNLPVEDMQIAFRAADETALRRAEPHDNFEIRPQRAGNLGEVSWVVSVSGEKRLFVTASAKAWRNQAVVARPISARTPIGAADVTERRQLVDVLPPDPLLAKDAVVGQAAARDLKPGQVVTGQMVQAITLVRAGQDVMLDTAAGGIRLLTAARALSDGTMGQTVRMRNEQTREQFTAVVTGPKRVSLAAAGMAGSVR